jgi:hypothetical protein
MGGESPITRHPRPITFGAMLLAVLALNALLQDPPKPATIVRDSTPTDSTKRNAPRRLPVTAEVRASAFKDAAARELFDRAQRVRTAQDSSITNYDATTRQRFTVRGSIGKLGLERLIYRNEGVAHVQWQRDVGAHVEITGARAAIPIIGSKELEKEALDEVAGPDFSPIPYFPGSETLWAGAMPVATEVNERDLVHPLAKGAEAYYTYKTGDSVTFRLPDGRSIQLRELELRPRAPKPNLAVGSFWFDIQTGQLVRAVFRLATPASANVSVSNEDSTVTRGQRVISAVITGMFSPMKAEISNVVIEYGLFGGRFWLPRAQSVEGWAQISFGVVKIKYENAFTYSSVNGPDQLAAFDVDTITNRPPRMGRPPAGLDSAARRKWRDSARVVYDSAIKARQDSIGRKLKVGSFRQCDTSAVRIVTQYRYGDARVPVKVRVPCDVDKLIQSSDFDRPIYDDAEDAFGASDRERLIGEALGMLAQAPLFSFFPMPKPQYGFSMTRYNRVEGFSTGLRLDQQIGGGYSVGALGRYGFSDQVPNWELAVTRSNMSKVMTLNGYNRLVSANDWGNPLSFSSGLSALLFGRDDGFYYRASGAELLWTTERGPRLSWRAFAEKERTAIPRATRTVGGRFGPNIVATGNEFFGGSVRFQHTAGMNPRAFRLFTDLRLEGAGGDSTYGRGALDWTLSKEVGKFAAALTAAGGTSVGGLPMQRRWFLGSTQTVRGQRPDTALSGNAFWLGRLELARPVPGMRFSLFGDLGWVGDRTKLDVVGRPLSGAGIGISGLDGLIRFDVARGIHPGRKIIVNLYLDARF